MERFPHRERINRILFEKYGNLRDKKRFVNYYEDYNNYPALIFDNIDFTCLDDAEEENLLNIELFEDVIIGEVLKSLDKI